MTDYTRMVKVGNGSDGGQTGPFRGRPKGVMMRPGIKCDFKDVEGNEFVLSNIGDDQTANGNGITRFFPLSVYQTMHGPVDASNATGVTGCFVLY
tara:strand:+ start:667 stop:951 length:285 start_codon:yes stop_codon:yes gene_type:complete